MANRDSKSSKKGNLVDISSNTQIKKVYKKKGRAKRAVSLVLSVVFLICGCGFLYYYSILGSLNFKSLTGDEDNTSSTSATSGLVGGDTTHLSLNDGELLEDSKVLNVMLFGEDNSGGSGDDDFGLSDSMIMVSIDNRHKKLKITSFQRDTYVDIPGYGGQKLNAAYSNGGPKLSIQTIESNFGIKVDRYAVVDYSSFIKIIDILGGIEMEITQDEIDYINYQLYKNGQSDTPSEITDEPGLVLLTGQQALWYARDRGLDSREEAIGIAGDDWDRTERQRKLLEKMFSDMKSADLAQIVSIVSAVGPLVTTNLKKDEITSLVTRSLTYLSYDVEQYNVPSEGLWYYPQYEIPGVGSVIMISDLEAQRYEFASFIFEELITSGN